MHREPNPVLERKILDALTEKYHLTEKREGIHLSTLINCLTRSYLDLVTPREPTDREVLVFSTGYGLEHVMSHSEAETDNLVECEGITYRPDNVFRIGKKSELVEMKSTRIGMKRWNENGPPDSWIEYMLGGCYIMKTNHYNLAVILVAERPSAALVCETITFEDYEIEQQWEYITQRRDAYQMFIDKEEVPTPFFFNKDYECDNCRYKMQCDTIAMLEQAKKDKELYD